MKKLINLVIIFFGVTTLVSSIYKSSRSYIEGFLLKHYAQYTKAVIIDEKNTIVNQLNKQLSYIYLFRIGDKTYKNNAADSTLKVGDTIEIEYYKSDPNFNRPLHFKR